MNRSNGSTGLYTDDRYRAFHDGMLNAGVTLLIAKKNPLQPVTQWWLPPSGHAERKINGYSFNSNEDTTNSTSTVSGSP